MLPAQRAELQKGRVSMRTGNLPLTKTIRSSHANHEASSIDIVQQQRKFGKVNLRQLLRGGENPYEAVPSGAHARQGLAVPKWPMAVFCRSGVGHCTRASSRPSKGSMPTAS